MSERADGGFRCNCPQCQARYDLCPAARELEEIITSLTGTAQAEAGALRSEVARLTRELEEAKAQRDAAFAVDWRGECDRLTRERERLRDALIRVRAHTDYSIATGDLVGLLTGLLASISRITDAALLEEVNHDPS